MIAVGHAAVELTPWLEDSAQVSLIPASLFLIPIIYAGLNFGLRGAAPTAVWCAMLTLPNATLLHEGPERFVELWQTGLVVAVGLFVGYRINQERRARAEAERRESCRRASEARFRELFESTADAILLLRPGSVIDEANPAAAALFGMPRAALYDRVLSDLGGPELAQAIRDPAPHRVVRIACTGPGGDRWVHPVVTEAGALSERVQVMLRDVTAQHERQEGLEAYARQALAAREEERRRIARDLHDGPVQELVLLWRRLDELADDVPPEGRSRLGEARSLAERIADNVRRVSRELRPSLLDDLGLGPALKAEAVDFAMRTGIETRFVQSGAVRRLPPDSELMLLRIAQEALRNVERHARARKATVRLTFRQSAVRLTVTDDGQGIRPPADDRSLLLDGKLGLVGMRERARLAGGQLTVQSGRDRRTSISVAVPV